ncbi:hypothetical protein LSH36_381g01030 [Paralvinella palmiformis]|uniref:Uncharacterized protein n=1 Tax=Paralvinella palmiformis TaxID=53620 RepID=A0AAD9JD32_9ANNE|nr:hypothetical protein LSH36_381g01030 [Paralvinella palmiformis]
MTAAIIISSHKSSFYRSMMDDDLRMSEAERGDGWRQSEDDDLDSPPPSSSPEKKNGFKFGDIKARRSLIDGSSCQAAISLRLLDRRRGQVGTIMTDGMG